MFSIKESLKYGWEKSKENMELVFYTTLLMLALISLTDSLGFIDPLFNILAMIFVIILRIGYTKIFLKIYDKENPKFSEIFHEYKTFLRYLGTIALTILLVVVGIIFLVIPGIILAIRLSFGLIIIVDTKNGIISSIKESFNITKGNFWKLLGFWFVTSIINIIGLIFFGIGLLLTIPITTFAHIYVYRLLTQNKASIIKSSPQVPA